MSDKKNSTDDPILVVVKRGRNGKGFIVTPADSDTSAPCMNAEDIGEVIIELLDDEAQPRLDANTVGKKEEVKAQEEQEASEAGEPDEQEEEPVQEENPHAEQGGSYGEMDPLDRILIAGATKLFNFGRRASDRGNNRNG